MVELACQDEPLFVPSGRLARKLLQGRVRRGPAWDCGFPQQPARMQDTAEGFGPPIKQIFEPIFRIDRQVPSPFDDRPRYHGIVEDKLWYALYLPVAMRPRYAQCRHVGRVVERCDRDDGSSQLEQEDRVSLQAGHRLDLRAERRYARPTLLCHSLRIRSLLAVAHWRS